jgi:phosphomannomutase/phosphoglucomutase
MNEPDAAIFREYDIRGIVATQLQDDVVSRIASAIATLYREKGIQRVVVGMDGRPSSPRLKEILVNHLTAYGLEVMDIGMVPTPVMYFALFRRNMDGGIVITASHNPGEYNGFKIFLGKEALSTQQIKELYHIARSGEFCPKKPGKITTEYILPEYLDYIADDIKLKEPVKIVVDAGNGTGGITAPDLYRKIGAEVVELYCEQDGTFPNHYPDPTKEKNLTDLIRTVKETGADLGVAFDGDGDRISVIAPDGSIL